MSWGGGAARRSGSALVAAALALCWCRAGATQEASLALTSIDVHGVVSQGFILSTQNEYLARSKHGSFELTEVGINFSTSLSDNLRVGMQRFANDLGPLNDYHPEFDWYSLDYRAFDGLGIRIEPTRSVRALQRGQRRRRRRTTTITVRPVPADRGRGGSGPI